MGDTTLKILFFLLICAPFVLYVLQEFIIRTREPYYGCTGIEGREVDRVSVETAGGVGELLAAAEKVLQYRGVITDYPPLFLYERADRIPGFALDMLAHAVKKIREGEASKPSPAE